MPQWHTPHLKGAVFKDALVLGGINLDPLHLIRQLRVKIPEVILQYLPKGSRSIDL
jgi:hypothetical protein